MFDFFDQKVFADVHSALYVEKHSEKVIILPQDIEYDLLLALGWSRDH